MKYKPETFLVQISFFPIILLLIMLVEMVVTVVGSRAPRLMVEMLLKIQEVGVAVMQLVSIHTFQSNGGNRANGIFLLASTTNLAYTIIT